jgi:hypothetical protein
MMMRSHSTDREEREVRNEYGMDEAGMVKLTNPSVCDSFNPAQSMQFILHRRGTDSRFGLSLHENHDHLSQMLNREPSRESAHFSMQERIDRTKVQLCMRRVIDQHRLKSVSSLTKPAPKRHKLKPMQTSQADSALLHDHSTMISASMKERLGPLRSTEGSPDKSSVFGRPEPEHVPTKTMSHRTTCSFSNLTLGLEMPWELSSDAVIARNKARNAFFFA